MSAFHVNLIAINPKDERVSTPPVEVLVDTGSELSWLPRQVLLDAGICDHGSFMSFLFFDEFSQRLSNGRKSYRGLPGFTPKPSAWK